MPFVKERLREAIEQEGRTIKWISSQTRIKEDTLRRYLQGHVVPSDPVVVLLAIKLNTSPEYLFGEDNYCLNKTEGGNK